VHPSLSWGARRIGGHCVEDGGWQGVDGCWVMGFAHPLLGVGIIAIGTIDRRDEFGGKGLAFMDG